jgi:hypothetical protein
MATATSDLDGLPRVTVSTIKDGYSATVEILGLSPKRDISPEERFSGIASLNPPRVVAKTRHELIRRAIRATLASVESTDGTLAPNTMAAVAYGVDFATRNAFEAMGLDA